jgi:uncharacterized membrane protein (DUF4010 family)
VSTVLASLVDVDAITLSLAELRRTGMEGAAVGIVVAAIVNTLSKGAIAMALGGRALGKHVARAFLLMLLAGVVGFAAGTVMGW